MLLNLTANAAKYTGRNGRIGITTELLRSKNQVRIRVKDTGIGIRARDQKKLFKLYGYLESSRKLNSKGIGLGLYICKQISQKFGGSVSLESQMGIGSNFTFSFKLDSKINDAVEG